jgi:hypothetical protein
MSHTHASVLVHCVFSTKQRANLIDDPEALWRYLAVVAEDNKITLLCRCSKIMSPLNCNETLSPCKDGDHESERVPTGESD